MVAMKVTRSLIIRQAEWFGQPLTSIDVGWRIQCGDEYHDTFWGNVQNDVALSLLLTEINRRFGKINVIDERGALT